MKKTAATPWHAPPLYASACLCSPPLCIFWPYPPPSTSTSTLYTPTVFCPTAPSFLPTNTHTTPFLHLSAPRRFDNLCTRLDPLPDLLVIWPLFIAALLLILLAVAHNSLAHQAGPHATACPPHAVHSQSLTASTPSPPHAQPPSTPAPSTPASPPPSSHHHSPTHILSEFGTFLSSVFHLALHCLASLPWPSLAALLACSASYCGAVMAVWVLADSSRQAYCSSMVPCLPDVYIAAVALLALPFGVSLTALLLLLEVEAAAVAGPPGWKGTQRDDGEDEDSVIEGQKAATFTATTVAPATAATTVAPATAATTVSVGPPRVKMAAAPATAAASLRAQPSLFGNQSEGATDPDAEPGQGPPRADTGRRGAVGEADEGTADEVLRLTKDLGLEPSSGGGGGGGSADTDEVLRLTQDHEPHGSSSFSQEPSMPGPHASTASSHPTVLSSHPPRPPPPPSAPRGDAELVGAWRGRSADSPAIRQEQWRVHAALWKALDHHEPLSLLLLLLCVPCFSLGGALVAPFLLLLALMHCMVSAAAQLLRRRQSGLVSHAALSWAHMEAFLGMHLHVAGWLTALPLAIMLTR